MKFDFNRRNFVCLFPWLTDITATKCTGQICNTIGERFNLNTYIVTYKNEEYPRYKKYCPRINLVFLKGKLKYEGWSVFIDIIWFILKHARQIDILYLYHMPEDYLRIPFTGYLYKLINKNGVLFVRFEADISTLPVTYPYHSKKEKLFAWVNEIKELTVKKFFRAIDILGVLDNEKFDLTQQREFWQYVGDKVRVQLNGYRIYEDLIVKDFYEKEKIILVLGRLNSHQKGLDIFLEALKYINLSDWKVALAGNLLPEQKKQIEEIGQLNTSLEGRIYILGYIEDIEAYSQLMNDSMVFCLPSRYDGIPLVIPDAMARGCIIVGSDLFGIKEIATDNGRCGFFFPNGDSIKLASILNDIIGGKFNLAELSSKSRERAERIFQWDSIIENLHLEKFIK